MEWNPDYFYHVRGSWASRGRDEIIVFSLANAMPSAVIETEEARTRREKLLPQEWSDSFGDEFYEYALDNSFYFLAPRTDWKAQEKSVLAPGVEQPDVPTESELAESIEKLKSEVDT